MRISEAKQCIKEIYLHTDSVSALISERGVGKTSAYRQCAEELGIGYMGLYAAAMEGPDFMGLPDKDREKGITRYLAPQFLPTIQAVAEGLYPERGLLVLEEINRVPSDTTSVLYPLLLDRTINGHRLAPGWKIGVTMNPDTMNYSVSSLDDAMLDRFVAIEIHANLEDYLEYSLQNNPNDDVLAFLQAYPDMLLLVKKSADSTALSKAPTPRGWSKVQELLNNCTLDNRLMMELVSGILGPQAAASFYGYLKTRDYQIPAVNRILTSFDEVRPFIVDLIGKKRLDIINLLIRKVVTAFELSELHLENLNSFVESLPQELQILFFKLLAAKRPEEFPKVSENLNAFTQVVDKIVDLMRM